MNRDYKIEKINAYKKLIEMKRLPKVQPNPNLQAKPTVEDEILLEFTAWAEGQLARLLGEPGKGDPQTSLTEEETVFLKAWVRKLQLKVEARDTGSAPRSAPVQQAPRPQVRAANQTRTANTEERDSNEPISNRLRKPKAGQDLADALEEMERNGPEY